MRQGHIASVELLIPGTSDAAMIAQAREIFELKGQPGGMEGFEVWDRDRFVYRWPEQG